MPPTGAVGSLKRGVVVLKALASAGPGGLALTQIAARCGLPHSSAHRVLSQLREAHLVHQDAPDGAYSLGPLAFELGVAAAQQFDIRGRSRPALISLATELGDTVFLMMRSGSEAVCLEVESGPAPIQVVTLRIGSRRPLGVGAAGLAILAAIEQPERDDVLSDVLGPVELDWGITPQTLDELIAQTRRQGFSHIEDQITPGVAGVGMPILDLFGQPIGSVGVAAPVSRMPTARVRDVADALGRAVGHIQNRLFVLGPRGGPSRGSP
ncbi:IclR family transcriptional regulator [Streptomyces sp. NPDC001401]|uniref:IclR family transcriptional regulator n=1 Tax=Streptomyces sp. NPDC001401 TaxID=3364570 RepID=UPI0036853379